MAAAPKKKKKAGTARKKASATRTKKQNKRGAKKTKKKAASSNRRPIPRAVPTGAYRSGGPATTPDPEEAYDSHSQDYEHHETHDEQYEHLADQAEDERERYMSVGDHLEELRVRLFWIIGIVLAASAVAGFFSADLHRYLISPYHELTDERLILQNVYGGMEIYIKISIMAGLIASFPALVFIMWGFVTPAVSQRVAIYGHLAVAFSALLFWTGIAISWFYIFPISLQFLFIGMQLDSVAPVLAVERYYGFLMVLHISAGLAFQLPIVLVALGAFGILTVDWHRRTWKYAFIVIYVFSAVLTPPDPYSMVAVGSLLMLLYAISIGIVWLIERTRRKKDAAIDSEFAG